jgi:cation-transporting ATPase E
LRWEIRVIPDFWWRSVDNTATINRMTGAPGSLDLSDPVLRGLSTAEAETRAAAGRHNVDTTPQRTDADVIRANTLTFFNVLLAIMILALLVVGEFRDGLFVGAVVAANVAIATVQELIATRRLRALRALTQPTATVIRDGFEEVIPAVEVVEGDLLRLRPGDQVVADGRVAAEAAEIDESLLTGESDSVRRGPGDAIRSGSFCVAGECYYRAEHVGTEAYAVRLAADARRAVRIATPLTHRFQRLLRVLLIATGALAAALFIQFNVADRGLAESLKAATATVTTVVPVGLLLGMTVVAAVGALRVSRSGAIVQQVEAVEALNYVDVIGLDKTGTLTTNRLTFREVRWAPGASLLEGWLGAFAAASAGTNRTADALAGALAQTSNGARPTGMVPFSSARRWSALRLERQGEERTFVLGAPETVLLGRGPRETDLIEAYRAAAERGLRGVVIAETRGLPDPDAPLTEATPVALLTLADELRTEVGAAFTLMDELGIAPKIISGDNPHTVLALLRQMGLDVDATDAIAGADLEALSDQDFGRAVEERSVFGRITPQLKARIVEALKARGHFVAMVGDGANDVRALRAADVAVAMASGTAMTRGVAGIVLMEDSFAALIRGTQEATFVLGNTARLSKLFLAKSVYAYLLIFATNMLGLDFPFLPRQGAVTSLLTLGIPAVFIAIGAPPHRSGVDFGRSVLRFALPAGVALAAAAIFVQFMTEGLLGRGIAEARTLVAITVSAVGIAYVVEVLGMDGADWRRPVRPIATLLLAVALFALLYVIVTNNELRDFFAFTSVSNIGWAFATAATVLAIALRWALSRYWQRILDVVTARPGPEQTPRGRPA